jgi:NADH-quinone oxidoreductase subunit L
MTALPAGVMALLQDTAAYTAGSHVLDGSVAEWLWLVPVLPLLGFLINGALSLAAVARPGPGDPDAGHGDAATAHAWPSDTAGGAHGNDHHPVARHRFAGIVSVIGPLVLVLSFALTAMIFFAMRSAHATEPFIQEYFTWMIAGELDLIAAFQLDQLAMVMMLVITGVGALIHVFSVGYMRSDPGYPRYFAYLNLFIFFMLVLVLGANYPVMFIGWEGVGLCSYLLIGFWFSEKANADAGKKAFIVNRIGDFGFLVALMLLFAQLGTFDFQSVAAAAPQLSTPIVTAICLFLFLGCVGKSAQIPLYVWLPDAMAGPTPVSALIHAATMVTAGVYLVARSSFLFSLAPAAGLTVALTGAVTALFAATIGLKQWDIKKILAYSTVSQLGFMFMAVGVGAYVAGIFHLATHAFFKALLFLGSGSVIYAMHAAYHKTGSHEDAQDVRNMGGLRRFMPVTWVLMWIATLAIAGIPPFAGFFSKDEILTGVYARAHGSTLAEASWLGIPGSALLYFIYFIGIVTALLTAIYMTRMMLYTFHGPNRTGEAERGELKEAPWVMTAPLVVLGVLSAFGGWLNLPKVFTDILPVGPTFALEHWLEPVVGEHQLAVTHGEAAHLSANTEYLLIGVAVLVAVAGIALAWRMLKPEKLVPRREAVPEEGFERILAEKYFVDEGYDRALVQPMYQGSRLVLWRGIDEGLIDWLFVNKIAWRLPYWLGRFGSFVQSGAVGTYAWVLVLGVVAVIGVFTLR